VLLTIASALDRHFGVSRQRDRQAGEVPDSGDDALGGVRGQRAVEGPL
jgi:hypothetical protein